MPAAVRVFSADETTSALGYRDAIAAVENALRAGLDPDTDLPRSTVPLANGEFLLMPSEQGAVAGLKVLTVAPANPGVGLPRIQGTYLLFDRTTLTLRAQLDGAALTTLRTPSVSMAAIRTALTRSVSPLRVVVFGGGPQAVGHVEAIRAALAGEREVESVAYVTRSGRPPAADPHVTALTAGHPTADTELTRAGFVVCATTARTPLFDSAMLADDSVIVAAGSHEPDARELDGALLGRAQVIVESRASALRECGDVILAVDEGFLSADAVVPMREIVTGSVAVAADRPVVFKSSGMSWEDLVIAEAVLHAGEKSPTPTDAHTNPARRHI